MNNEWLFIGYGAFRDNETIGLTTQLGNDSLSEVS